MLVGIYIIVKIFYYVLELFLFRVGGESLGF